MSTLTRLKPRHAHDLEKELRGVLSSKRDENDLKVVDEHTSQYFAKTLEAIIQFDNHGYRLSGAYELAQSQDEQKRISAVLPLL